MPQRFTAEAQQTKDATNYVAAGSLRASQVLTIEHPSAAFWLQQQLQLLRSKMIMLSIGGCQTSAPVCLSVFNKRSKLSPVRLSVTVCRRKKTQSVSNLPSVAAKQHYFLLV